MKFVIPRMASHLQKPAEMTGYKIYFGIFALKIGWFESGIVHSKADASGKAGGFRVGADCPNRSGGNRPGDLRDVAFRVYRYWIQAGNYGQIVRVHGASERHGL